MDTREKLTSTVYDAIDLINQQRLGESPLEKAIGTPLFGSSSQLDSLGLVNFIITVEQKVEEDFQQAISLADDRALSQKDSPFSNVGSLVNYIDVLLKEKGL